MKGIYPAAVITTVIALSRSWLVSIPSLSLRVLTLKSPHLNTDALIAALPPDVR
jgi:hypothetical protein